MDSVAPSAINKPPRALTSLATLGVPTGASSPKYSIFFWFPPPCTGEPAKMKIPFPETIACVPCLGEFKPGNVLHDCDRGSYSSTVVKEGPAVSLSPPITINLSLKFTADEPPLGVGIF